MKPLSFPQVWALGALVTGATLCAVCLAAGLEQFANPSFSDEQIRASIVDTWGSSAMANYLVLRLLAVYGLVALAVASLPMQSHGAVRTVAALGVLLSVVAFVVMLCAHIVLTERATAITGQAFSRGWGLW